MPKAGPASFPMFPPEFRAEVNSQETRIMGLGLSSSEDMHDRSWSRFGMIPDCDGRTVRRSHGQTDRIYHG